MEHTMMLSDLYGRIGQILKEHGDAPIGSFKQPMNPMCHPSEFIRPKYADVYLNTLDIGHEKLKCYEIVIENQ